jgi:hypothetical protein
MTKCRGFAVGRCIVLGGTFAPVMTKTCGEELRAQDEDPFVDGESTIRHALVGFDGILRLRLRICAGHSAQGIIGYNRRVLRRYRTNINGDDSSEAYYHVNFQS